MKFQAAIFDMDGLLLDTERLSKRSFMATCDHFNLERDSNFFNQLIGLNSKKSNLLIEEFLNNEVELKTFETKWIETYRQSLANHIPVKDGVEELLAHLKDIGLPCAVATSTRTESACKYLERTSLLPYFKIVIGGDQVSNGKPAPDIYLEAAEVLNVIPENCIAFEDSENGVRAAVSAGMTLVQIPDLIEPSEELKSLNHTIANSLLEGARLHGIYR